MSKKLNTVEIRQFISSSYEKLTRMAEKCEEDKREMTEEEEKEFKELKEQIEEKKRELEELEEELKNYDDKTPVKEEEDIKEEKNKRNYDMNKTQSAAIQFRNNIIAGTKEFTLPTIKRALVVQGASGAHDSVIETTVEGILDPLYANSILTKLGVTYETGLPMGDLQYSKMTKGTVGFLGEIDEAQGFTNEFSYITLKPHRIAAYTDVSQQMLRQDTLGVFNKVQTNLVKKMGEYIESVFFSDATGTSVKPAGIFYDKSISDIEDYEDVCNLEAQVETNNVNGNMKYALSPTAKAKLRCTIKGTNATGMILEHNEVDGTPMEFTSNIPANKLIYGNWSDVVVALWGDTEIKVDPDIQYINGLVRVYATAFIDWALLRDESLVFGQVPSAVSGASGAVSGASGAVSGSNG